VNSIEFAKRTTAEKNGLKTETAIVSKGCAQRKGDPQAAAPLSIFFVDHWH
jgi:hypothetical protein